MKETVYLLPISGLLQEPDAGNYCREACKKLDRERLKKAERIKGQTHRLAECIGAGLLLQLGVQEWQRGTLFCGESNAAKWRIEELSLSKLLESLGEPAAVGYTYGARGKPFFKDIPLFFSLSHSGEYVLCVFSDREVGADIQQMKPVESGKLIKRFFSQKEQAEWETLPSEADKQDYFYRRWVRREAYGKLTGEGIFTKLGNDEEYGADCRFWENSILNADYRIAICRYRDGEQDSDREKEK